MTDSKPPMDAADAARLVAILMRSDADSLGFFSDRTRSAKEVPPEQLGWWAEFLVRWARLLDHSHRARLDAMREALEEVELRFSETAPTEASPYLDLDEDEPSPDVEDLPSVRTRVGLPPEPGRPIGGRMEPTPPLKPAPPVPIAHASPPLPRNTTGAVDLSRLGSGAQLPFKGRNAPPQSAANQRTPHGGDNDEFGGETLMSADASVVHEALGTFALPVNELPIPVEQYVSLAAKLEVQPTSKELLHEHGVEDEAHWIRIEQEYRNATTQDGKLKEHVDTRLAQWRDWLKHNQG